MCVENWGLKYRKLKLFRQYKNPGKMKGFIDILQKRYYNTHCSLFFLLLILHFSLGAYNKELRTIYSNLELIQTTIIKLEKINHNLQISLNVQEISTLDIFTTIRYS